MEVEPAAETDDKPRWVPSAENAFFRHLIKEAADLLDQFPLEDENGNFRELDEETIRKLNNYVTRMAYQCQNHDHTGTCKKGGRKGDDFDCRMAYPRLLVVLSLMKDVEGSFLLKRNSATLVPYVRALILALPCNHTMSFASEISRWERDHYLWSEAKKNNKTQVSQIESDMNEFLPDSSCLLASG